jgi:hypothetical protein
MSYEIVGGSNMNNKRLQNFIREWLNDQWDEAIRSTQSIMESMGWEPFEIDKDKFHEFMDDTFLESINSVVNAIIAEAKSISRKLTEDDIVELLLWHSTGTLKKSDLRKYSQLADRLESIMSDNSANWIAEGFNKSIRA